MYFQGGCGDVNPLVEDASVHLESGHTIVAIGDIAAWYGARDDPNAYNIGNRTGGTFAGVAELAAAFSAEAMHVARGVRTVANVKLWSKRLVVDAARSPDEPVMALPPDKKPQPLADAEGRIRSEVMLLGMGPIILVGEPGEVFSETSVRLRTRLRLRGYEVPLLVSYANGSLGYLPEPEAFDEGGYEPTWPTLVGISRYYQQRVWEAVAANV